MNKHIKMALFIALLLAFVSTISYCSAPYDTETANMISIRKTVDGDGYIIRNENVVTQPSKGVFDSSVEDGARIYKGGTVGISISGNYSDELVKELAEVTNRIEEVRKSGSFADIYSSDEARVFSALRDITREIRLNVRAQNFTLASQNSKQLKTLLEKKQVSGNRGTAQELLSELESQKAELESRLGSIRENIIASSSGYFYTSLDGLEQKVSEKDLYNITTSDISGFSETLKKFKRTPDQVGKIVDTYSWYLVATVPRADAECLKKGAPVTLSIDEAPPLSATVEAVNHDEFDTSAVVVKCTRALSGIYEKRDVSFEICYEEHSGLFVPAAAMRIIDDVTGVYVINQNETVSFRAIDILTQEDDYLIVRRSYTPPADVKYSALKIYDNVLVNPEVVRKGELEK